MASTTPTRAPRAGSSPRRDRTRTTGLRRGETAAGWLFTAPVILILGVFLAVPVFMALWVSFSDWGGRGSPFSDDVSFVGFENYGTILAGGGLAERDFGISLRNNAWYVLLVVPLQTALSLFLAVLVNRAVLRGRGLFRTAFYFPSVTSSVAITVLWLFLFSASGVVNTVLAAVGIAGPSVAMSAFVLMAVFTTSGTFMLLFLAALQNLGGDVTEAAMMDGANGWQRFWRVTLPQLKPTLFTVLTLGLIGCWQVFDQIYTGTQGGPSKTTLTPAYLSYTAAFNSQDWGQGAAIAFILFLIIVAFTLLQRWILRDRPVSKRRAAAYLPKASGTTDGMTR
jgi:multiple sugar transport system permease protein